jgi:hypothetical protein
LKEKEKNTQGKSKFKGKIHAKGARIKENRACDG